MKDEIKLPIVAVIHSIPEGKVSSYGAVAIQAGLPGYGRIVAKVLSGLEPESAIPWHRVIKSTGKIAFPIDSDSFILQKQRLIKEGIPVSADGKIPAKFRLGNP